MHKHTPPNRRTSLTHRVPSTDSRHRHTQHAHCGASSPRRDPGNRAPSSQPRKARLGGGLAGWLRQEQPWRDQAPVAGTPASGQVTAVPEPAPACPRPVPLSLSFPGMAQTAASHLDVRELAQVRVHGEQRLVHQLLVVIHPEQVVVLKERQQVSAPQGASHPSPQLSPPRNLGAQLLPHHFKVWWLLKTSVSSSVKWASSRGQQGPMGGLSHLPYSPRRSCSLRPCQASRAHTPPADTRSASWRPRAWLGGRGPCCSQGHGDLGWRVPRGPGGMWASTLVLALSPQAVTPSKLFTHQLHVGRPRPASVKSGPPRPSLPLTFDGGQVGPEILLEPGALILQRKR